MSGKLARQIASAKTVAAVERLARSHPKIAVAPEQFDADLYLFNTPTGTIELRTGTMRSHRRTDLITKTAAVSPDFSGEAGTWRKFLFDITLGDVALQGYLQRLFGYALSGDVKEHALAFFHGSGANGKSTLLDLILHIMGDYARVIPTESLMESRGDRHPTEIAHLKGVRLAVSSEIEEGLSWAESRIKSLTGDAVLTGRYMRQDFFEFRRTHKLIVAGNHRPAIRTVDDAMRRRVHLVPFRAQFMGENADPDMPAKLAEEAGAVLVWMIEGFLDWQEGGLRPPQSVLEATANYFYTQDTLGQWIEERCTLDAKAETQASTLYGSYRDWKELRGEKALSQKRFGEQLEARFSRRHTRYGNVYAGLAVRLA